MPDKPKESDWKAFRNLVPDARERYLEKVNSELADLLQSGKGTPTERFWEAEEKIKNEARILRLCLDGHSRSRSQMFMSILMMRNHEMLTEADLEKFSTELRDRILALRDL